MRGQRTMLTNGIYIWTSFFALKTLSNAPLKFGYWGIGTDRKVSSQELLGRHHAQEQTTGLLCETVIGRISVMCLRGVAVVPRCLVRYGSTGQNDRISFGGGVTGWFLVDFEWKTNGGMGVLVGGESKCRSTENEGIGGDPVDDGWSDMTKFRQHSHVHQENQENIYHP